MPPCFLYPSTHCCVPRLTSDLAVVNMVVMCTGICNLSAVPIYIPGIHTLSRINILIIVTLFS